MLKGGTDNAAEIKRLFTSSGFLHSFSAYNAVRCDNGRRKIFIVAYILIKGIPNITPELFACEYTSKNVSMMPAIINTLLMTGFTLLMAVPVGVFSAVYLAEYAKRGSKLVKLIRVTVETLSGIPSIVYGLFGFLAFVIALKWEYSFLAGSITLAIMVLPVIMRTTEEAILSVPDSFREGSFGLGAGKLRTIFKIVIPSAMPVYFRE